ncbi:hypothetical protein [Sphingomonas sp.]|uniref:hypothetical protein n=1 Tax=Sphingomonas sp. TaxID=28214 RepID=UPI0025F0E5ED|nr:hypothetical protein [Sphingomonas sp.]
MLKLLRHLLCLGILFALAGNGVAVAAPCMFMNDQAATSAAMPDCNMPTDCPDCASKAGKSGKDSKSSGCLLMVACGAVLGVAESQAPSLARAMPITAAFWPRTAILAGRNTGPEPEPPTFLG